MEQQMDAQLHKSAFYVFGWAWRRHYLGFHVSELPSLLGCLREQVGAHFQHGCCVVVDGALLQLDHLRLHALLDVVLNLYQIKKPSKPIKPQSFLQCFDPFWVFLSLENQHTISCLTLSQNIPSCKILYRVLRSVALWMSFQQTCPFNEETCTGSLSCEQLRPNIGSNTYIQMSLVSLCGESQRWTDIDWCFSGKNSPILISKHKQWHKRGSLTRWTSWALIRYPIFLRVHFEVFLFHFLSRVSRYTCVYFVYCVTPLFKLSYY